MYSVPVRANAVFCHWAIVVSVLAAACKLTTTPLLHTRGPVSVDLRIDGFDYFSKNIAGFEEASVLFTLDADLRNVWTWNTQQLYVALVAQYNSTAQSEMIIWDRIITNKNQARIFVEKQGCKYPISDQAVGMRYV